MFWDLKNTCNEADTHIRNYRQTYIQEIHETKVYISIPSIRHITILLF